MKKWLVLCCFFTISFHIYAVDSLWPPRLGAAFHSSSGTDVLKSYGAISGTHDLYDVSIGFASSSYERDYLKNQSGEGKDKSFIRSLIIDGNGKRRLSERLNLIYGALLAFHFGEVHNRDADGNWGMHNLQKSYDVGVFAGFQTYFSEKFIFSARYYPYYYTKLSYKGAASSSAGNTDYEKNRYIGSKVQFGVTYLLPFSMAFKPLQTY